jgi:hypothetical protein
MGQLEHTPTRPPARHRHPGDAPRPSREAAGNRFRYGGPWFSAASALPLDPGLGRLDRLARLLAVAVRRPRRMVALIVLLVRTQSEEVFLSQSVAGRSLQEYFDHRFLGVFPQNQLCRAVLVLPERHDDYLRGRRRQALRTNLRRAAATGIQCESQVRSSRALDAARVILDRRMAPSTEADLASLTRVWPALFSSPDVTLTLAKDPHDEPLALMAAVIDESVCVIHVAVASDHEARWALHDHLVRLLIARGVRYLLSEGGGPFGALGFAPEVHHYQRLLGYELRHLIPRSAHPVGAPHGHRPVDPLTRRQVGSGSDCVR